jgi:PadR family transcriptional regulator, regulatory protein PadR
MRRHSVPTRQVFQVLLDADGELYGFEIVKATKLPSGTVYPIMRRLEDRRLVSAREEVINPLARRPRVRIYYKLTADGQRVAREATRDAANALRSLNTSWQA